MLLAYVDIWSYEIVENYNFSIRTAHLHIANRKTEKGGNNADKWVVDIEVRKYEPHIFLHVAVSVGMVLLKFCV